MDLEDFKMFFLAMLAYVALAATAVVCWLVFRWITGI